jgi:hypothetical protein
LGTPKAGAGSLSEEASQCRAVGISENLVRWYLRILAWFVRRHVGDLVPPSPELDPVEVRRGLFAWCKARAACNAAGFKNEARRATPMTRTAIAVLAALTLGPMPSVAADNLAGRASVIDGDTLEIHGTRIRLWGIDAPESNQLCRGEDSLQYRCGAKGRERSRCIHCRTASELHSDLAGPVRAHGGLVFG